ncbi:C2H2-type zinc-finger protein [Ceratobasidium theobromae]|uniref:C2H2-type zinc-finger protein n=1 Tax=Ceratobasidium theobromae TaxID=1582974 RepID=A0A5N5QSE5_9AGAM|nr:C2H2-type zinc-finger protein [Ceratobasidium theobromae]
MPDDVAPRGWVSHIHSYHEPTSPRTATPEGAFIAKSRIYSVQNSAADSKRPRLCSPNHTSSPPVPIAEVPIEKPTARRLMYDPVRDSVASSPAASPHAAPASGPLKAEGRNLTTARLEEDISCAGAGRTTPDARCASDNEDGDLLIRTRIIRGFPQHQSQDRADLGIVGQPQLRQAHSILLDGSRAVSVHVSHVHTEIDAGGQELKYSTSKTFSKIGGLSGSKRSCTEMEDDVDHRYRKAMSREVNGYAFVASKGKPVLSQSPAFRLDNLLEHTQDSDKLPATTNDNGRANSPSESHANEHSSGEPSYVFTGKLPPPPFTGHSAGAPTAHTSIGDLGITVSKDLNLGRFAVPDDFERAILATAGPITNAVQSTLPSSSRSSETKSNVKRARKHTSTSQRRKTRGVFPQDNVPLAISTSTTKQSRYRPSGDRQPVACGYKDPITQIQCDEPFNRSVELRRHVRAVHVPAEALAVTMGQLSRSQATLLPADWKPGDGDVLRPKCLCGKEFSRLDALRRHWTGVQAEVKDGKCISCPSSLSKKKDHPALEQQGAESTYGTPLYS